MGASIRDNILFSHEYDEEFYNLVLDGVYPRTVVHCAQLISVSFCIACTLRPDLELFPNGDLTEVGEKGVSFASTYSVGLLLMTRRNHCMSLNHDH